MSGRFASSGIGAVKHIGVLGKLNSRVAICRTAVYSGCKSIFGHQCVPVGMRVWRNW